MKRIAALTLLTLGLIAPIVMTGCGDDKKASEPIKADATKAPAK